MARKFVGTAFVCGSVLVSSTLSAFATEKSEALAVCTIEALSVEETDVMATWLIMGLSSHPAMSGSFAVPQASRDAVNEAAAGIFTAIWAERCADERQAAYDESGDEALNETQMMLNIHLVNSTIVAPEVVESLSGVNAYFK